MIGVYIGYFECREHARLRQNHPVSATGCRNTGGGSGGSGGVTVVAMPRVARAARNGAAGMHRSGGTTPVSVTAPSTINSAPMAPATPTAYSVALNPQSGLGGNLACAWR